MHRHSSSQRMNGIQNSVLARRSTHRIQDVVSRTEKLYLEHGLVFASWALEYCLSCPLNDGPPVSVAFVVFAVILLTVAIRFSFIAPRLIWWGFFCLVSDTV